ncbi:D-alanine--D-alanine ligase [Algoriphagus halophytocola]|uniref:D-alanine--D-alanine ligase n=1 Tax=Algoriphagus halophytocola TaxID=2991499 RepID=A0ABY6MDW9_9BACT|nr:MULTISPECIES: D-alanine--D-alanine ligase [unclassified Algoriphagus]UZD21104.1 D-alanine--D-alanine ligase [Algoriphagus sp. TR-M5]WBL42272.1 D-alanine--D-alanine ligase [Algoriphagus sp. TR-M9]
MKRKIALVTGGYTGESVISLKSAAVVEQTIDRELYEVYKILIYPGDWHYLTDSGEKIPVDLNDFSIQIGDEKITFDGIFNILHGSPGEDGKLAGYFDMIGIPYTTCDQLTSAITMNKGYTKAIVDDIEELYIAKSIQLFENSPKSLDKVNTELTLPLFIKPNNGGSSIGMSKVKSWNELPEALEKAFVEDTQVLVEEFVSGREFSIGCFKGNGETTVLPATEIVSSKEFFDYEAKYVAGVTNEITPGRMNEEEIERVNRIIPKIYEKLNCKGAVRIDYFLQNETGKFYFIEINTVPGQTETSLISQQVRAVGMEVRDFYTQLIEEMFT